MQQFSGKRWAALVALALFASCTESQFQTEPDNELTALSHELHDGGTWTVTPISSIPTAGSCTASCVTQLNSDNGSYLKWIACTAGNNTSTEYANPTDVRFTVANPAAVAEAKVEIDAIGSGTNATGVIECVNGSGTLLATIASSFKPTSTAALYSFPVPKTCFDGSTVTIRFRRTGSNCVGPDVIRLLTRSAPTEPVVSYPISAIPTAGSCTTACVSQLNSDNGSYLKWLACASGNTSTEYGTPTDLKFAVQEPERIKESTFVIDTYASNSAGAPMRIECLDGAGASKGTLFNGTIPSTAKTYEWPLPAGCFSAGTPITVRITRTGSFCLGVDFAKVYATYNGDPPAQPPPPPPPPPVPAGYVANTHAIEGYSDKISVAPGETIALKVHSPRPTFSIEFLRLGLQRQSLLTATGVTGVVQHYPNDAVRTGANWATSYTLTIPSDWTSGMYAARLYSDDGAEFYVTFIVRNTNPGSTARLGVLASTNTWTAYNSWGGGSFYTYTLPDGQGQRLSSTTVISQYTHFSRPNPSATPMGNGGHLANGEQHIIKWLEREGYGYEMLTDMDFHNTPSLLTRYSTLIINTHSEYWTSQMYTALETFLNQGGKLLYLSGNGIYWKVTVANGRLEVRKDGGKHVQTGETGGLWRNLGRAEHRVLGVGYTGTGANTSAPYQVKAPSHFVFAGTGVATNTLIGNSGLNLFGGKASGWETDKRLSGQTPSNAILLALGTNASSGGAQMLYFDRAAGGSVFSVGSINFGGSLIVDPVLTRMVRNVLSHYGIQPQQ